MFPLHDNNPTNRTPYCVVGLIVVNVLSFLWLSRQDPVDQQLAVIRYGFVPARVAQLTNPRLAVEVPLQEDPRVINVNLGPQQKVRLAADSGEILASTVTMMFLHGGWMHLIGNMWFLWLFGNNIEDRLGHVVFSLFYWLGGLMALICQWWIDPGSTMPVIGASGAVAAVLGAYAVTYPWARVRTLVFLLVFVTVVELPALVVLGLWFVMQVFEGLGAMRMQGLPNGENVAFWAHIGGFVVGALLMPLLAFGAAPPAQDERTAAQRWFE